MLSPSRREFLGASLAGLASAPAFAADPLPPLAKATEDFAFQPSTLFLTWQRDPTTTMTVQWVGTRGETSDPNVYYTTDPGGPPQVQKTPTKPSADTDLKLFRAELTGLKPDTDYWVKIGRYSPAYRFRTM